MGDIYQATKQFLEADDWPFIELEEMPVIKTGFEGSSTRWDCYARPIDEDDQLLFYSLCPIAIPTERRGAVMEYLTRANYGLRMGNFEMNPDDGEVRFKTSIDVEGAPLTTEMVRQLVYANVLMMDQYLPGLMAVVHGHADPVRALAQVEGLPEAEA